MLYFLPYVNHEVEKLHNLLVYFFDKVLSDSPTTFSKVSLLPIWYQQSPNRLLALERHLKKFVEEIDRTIQVDIINAFKLANDIEYIFSNKKYANQTVIHVPIAADFPAHEAYLNDLFVTLYDSQLSKKESTFISLNNNLTFYDHFDDLRDATILAKGSFSVCPYCGLENLRMPYSEGRPDYDHLLPKGNSLFVFSAVNMKNLFPSGIVCNKLKDTSHLLYSDTNRINRTIAFYPYSHDPDPYTLISFNLQCIEYPTLKKGGQWNVLISSIDPLNNDLLEKITTWTRVFNIHNRYNEYISQKGYILLKNLIRKVSITDTEQRIREKIENKLLDELDLQYELVSTEEGLIPKRIFFQWLLSENAYLAGLINAQIVTLSLANTGLDTTSSDFE